MAKKRSVKQDNYDKNSASRKVKEAEDSKNAELTEEERKRLIIKELVGYVIYIAFLILCVWLIITFVGQRTTVSGESMYDTLDDGDSLWMDKISYRFKDPERFDIIVFPVYDSDYDMAYWGDDEEFDDEDEEWDEGDADDTKDEYEYFIKRIIGLPGETVRIDMDGSIYINGSILKEDYGYEPIDTAHIGRAIEEVKLGDDEYFVMGDNRNASEDSRFELVGNLKRERIVGKAVLRMWPLKSFGKIDK